MEDILVSIVIPCFNNANTVTESVKSCLGQTYSNIEIIVVNDGSTDGSEDIIKALGRHHFSRIKVYSQSNKGPSRTRNFGAMIAVGDYIVFLDADDKFAPTFVQECIDIFRTNSGIDIVYPMVERFEEESGIWNLPDYSMEELLNTNCFPIASMVALSKFKAIGMFDENLQHAEDWELWIRLTSKYPRAYRIEKPLYFYRKRTSKDSITDKAMKYNYSDHTHLYIYNKHYELYKKYKMSINDLFLDRKEGLLYKHKYKDVWYRKLFYKVFKGR